MDLQEQQFIRRNPPQKLTIEDAVAVACGSDANDALDRTRDEQDNLMNLVGRLISELHASKRLNDKAVLRILGSRVEVFGFEG